MSGIGFIGLPYIRDTKAIAISEANASPLLPNNLTVGTEDYLLALRSVMKLTIDRDQGALCYPDLCRLYEIADLESISQRLRSVAYTLLERSALLRCLPR